MLRREDDRAVVGFPRGGRVGIIQASSDALRLNGSGNPDSTGPRRRERRLANLSILVVEDEDDSRELIEMLLVSEGATVRCAASAMAALLMLDEVTPDIVVSDIGMPVRDGYWLASEMRTRRPHMPAIALTAFSAPEDVARAFESGFDKHIGKPVDLEVLVRALTTCCPRAA